jgi:hypothetical protein
VYIKGLDQKTIRIPVQLNDTDKGVMRSRCYYYWICSDYINVITIAASIIPKPSQAARNNETIAESLVNVGRDDVVLAVPDVVFVELLHCATR